MPKINVLTKEVAELIAAGEVIERPCSVIKEVIENAIDSGATSITAEMKNGGVSYMRVTDNGCGIAPEDVPVAFLRHATSKIRTKDDLNSIYTLGFRGEALASVAAVAKVEILTRQQGSDFGTHYVIEGTREKLCEQSGCPIGTTIIIRDIFYNVPARLKFLKKDVTEGNSISSVIQKIALSHPEISFKLIRDNRQDLYTPGDGDLYSAVYSVFGKAFANTLIPVNCAHNGVKVTGFISSPAYSRSNRAMQNFFVNSRYVKSMTCMAALEEAYRNSMMVGKFPACVLNVELPAELLDVNVHPAKVEVRFSDEKLVFDSIYFAVKNALMTLDKSKELVIGGAPKSYEDYKRTVFEPIKGEQTVLTDVKKSDFTGTSGNSASYNTVKDVPKAVKPHTDESVIADISDENEDIAYEKKACGSAAYKKEDTAVKADTLTELIGEKEFKYISSDSFEKKEAAEIVEVEEKKPFKLNIIGEIFTTYILAQADDKLMIIDKHAAHERLLFEKIKAEQKNLDIQMFITPEEVILTYEEYDAVMSQPEVMERLGFLIREGDAPNVLVEGIPVYLDGYCAADILPEIARNIIECKSDPQSTLLDDLFHSIACKSAIKAHDHSDIEELKALAERVYGNENVRYCPHGRPVMMTLSKRDLEKQFKRIV